ncbi:MAG: phage major capsid protein [Elusimicrobia bacterium]|nr:phage major capsid protein [Elusimicrobiota bacterium]
MSAKLKELQGKLAKSQEKMGKILEQAGPDLDFKKVTEVSGSDSEKAAAFRAINEECSVAQKEVDEERSNISAKEAFEKRSLIAKVAQPGSGAAKEVEVKGEKNLADAMFKHADIDPESLRTDGRLKAAFWNKEVELPLGVTMKTLMDTTAWVPETFRTGKVVDKAARPIQVTDLIPAGQTGQAAVVYMEETTLTENAAEIAEAGTYGENAYALTERSETVRKIAAWLPITDEQLEDVPQVRGYINQRLPMSLRRRLDGQIINGSGISPYLTGILNKASIQTHVRSSVSGDKPVDALYRAMRKVRVTGRALPNGIIIHPEDFESIRLMKTNDGQYVWGHPAEAGPERIWGLPIAQSDILTAGTAIVADFSYSELAERRGIVVKMTDAHSTYFIEGKQAIRADMRAAFLIYRAAAFVAVTL